mmetsp:Transcript_87417/g.187507  ORF Transcript_87417/g.187507 Transcript_87417/m.187507 type:complete len:211 (+) Transcript_87417:547-1179(+)
MLPLGLEDVFRPLHCLIESTQALGLRYFGTPFQAGIVVDLPRLTFLDASIMEGVMMPELRGCLPLLLSRLECVESSALNHGFLLIAHPLGVRSVTAVVDLSHPGERGRGLVEAASWLTSLAGHAPQIRVAEARLKDCFFLGAVVPQMPSSAAPHHHRGRRSASRRDHGGEARAQLLHEGANRHGFFLARYGEELYESIFWRSLDLIAGAT